jgi:hypothetical protein
MRRIPQVTREEYDAAVASVRGAAAATVGPGPGPGPGLERSAGETAEQFGFIGTKPSLAAMLRQPIAGRVWNREAAGDEEQLAAGGVSARLRAPQGSAAGGGRAEDTWASRRRAHTQR